MLKRIYVSYASLNSVIAIIILFTAVIIWCSFSLVYGQSNNSMFVTYGKSIFGLSIKHPQDWEIKGYDRNVRDDRIGSDLFAVTCPKSILEYPYKDKGFMTDYSECPDSKEVTIGINKFPRNVTLDEYVNLFSKVKNLSLIDYKLLEVNNSLLSGLPARKSVYSYLGENNDENEIIKVLEIVTIPGNRAYTVSYHSPILEFDDLLPTVQKIVDSLKITPIPQCNFVKNENFTEGGKCVLKSPAG